MIVAGQPSWFRIIFWYRGTTLSTIWLRLVVTMVVSLVVTVFDLSLGFFHPDLTPTPFTLIGFALSVFLGFRNDETYKRFWEGRILWGALVNTTRSFTRQIFMLIDPPQGAGPAAPDKEAELDGRKRALVYRIIAFVHAMRMHLRDEVDLAALRDLLPREEFEALAGSRNRPAAIALSMGYELRALWRDGLIHAMHLPVLEASLTELTSILGGCERIKSTPIPFSFTVLIHRTVAVYCLSLPFGLVHSIGFYTPVVVLLVCYAFYSLDAVGEELENPFGLDANDLPLVSMSRSIEILLRQQLGETDLPPPIPPSDHILL